MPDRRQPVLEGMGTAYFRMVPLAGVQIVVDAVHAGGFELSGLLFSQEAERAADLDGSVPFDRANRLRDDGDLAIEGAATADHDAVTLGLGRDGSSRAFAHTIDGNESVSIDVRARDRGLRAVVAVLLTGAALGIQQHLQSDGAPKVPLTDLKRGVEQLQ